MASHNSLSATPKSLAVALTWLLLVGACSPAATATPNPGAMVGGEWGPVAVYQSNARMAARNEGTLVITADCTFLQRDGQRALLAWPIPETAWDPALAQISFKRRDGRVVSVRNGQYVVLGGGGSSRAEDGLTGEEWANQVTWVARPKAACLVDERFLVSEVMD